MPLNRGVAHCPHAVRASQQNRSLKKTGFLDPVDACHVTVTILVECRCEHGIPIGARPWKDRGDPCTYRSLTRNESAVTLDECDVSNSNAGNVCDRIQWTSLSRERNP